MGLAACGAMAHANPVRLTACFDRNLSAGTRPFEPLFRHAIPPCSDQAALLYSRRNKGLEERVRLEGP